MDAVSHFDMLLVDDDLKAMRDDPEYRMSQWFQDDRDGEYYEMTVRHGTPPEEFANDPQDNFMVKVP